MPRRTSSRRDANRRPGGCASSSTPELQERELIKLAAMADGVTQALRRRGVGDPAAALAAEAGIAVFRVGFSRWVAEDNRDPLRRVLRDALGELRAVAAG